MTDGFFESQREQSRVKSEIVARYFDAWSNIIQNTQQRMLDRRLGYVDLFCGPGIYNDGSRSTPLKILERALADDHKCKHLVTVFNDVNSNHTERLTTAIASVPKIERLANAPLLLTLDASDAMTQARECLLGVPTLYFIDPTGYKGVTLPMLAEAISDWGSEFILFFNYSRINQAVTIQQVAEHIDAFFGCDRASVMRSEILRLDPHNRELYITEQATEALLEAGAAHVLPFSFKRADGTRTSHYLVFATKNFKGYDEMKRIMAREGTHGPDGVPTFQYCEADVAYPRLFGFTQSIDDLKVSLLAEYAGSTLTLDEIYGTHSVGRPFIRVNYTNALADLEDSSAINVVRPPRGRRRAFGPNTMITFPQRGR